MARFLGLGNGRSGAVDLDSFTQVKASCSGSAGSSSLSATESFSPGDRLFIIQSRGTGVGAYEDNRVLSYSTGTITLEYPLENDYTDSGASQAQVLVVPEASTITGTYTLPAWDGDVGGCLVLACDGLCNISGNIDGSGPDGVFVGGSGDPGGNISRTPRMGFGGGECGEQPGETNAYFGEGTAGDRTTRSTSANGNGGGGGYSNASAASGHGASGGGGGNGTAGGNGLTTGSSVTGGTGGSVSGNSELTLMTFGGGGGGANGAGGSEQGTGGSGGGIVVLYCRRLVVSGTIDCSGGIGGSEATSANIDGGSGAGGSILIKSVSCNISGTITAAGGASIGGGGQGGDGRIRIETCSLTGTTTPAASTSIGGHAYCGGGAFII